MTSSSRSRLNFSCYVLPSVCLGRCCNKLTLPSVDSRQCCICCVAWQVCRQYSEYCSVVLCKGLVRASNYTFHIRSHRESVDEAKLLILLIKLILNTDYISDSQHHSLKSFVFILLCQGPASTSKAGSQVCGPPPVWAAPVRSPPLQASP